MKYRKIYIIGPVASGKTTLGRYLSKENNIKLTELDTIIWDDNKGIKRSSEEALKIFKKIIKDKSWIIEDVGRDIFREGIKEADIVYYIKLSKKIIYFRIIKRWLRQNLKIEESPYKPTLKNLMNMFKYASNDLNNNWKLEYIINNSKSYQILTKKDIKNML